MQSNVDLGALLDRWRHRVSAAAADDLPPKLAGFLLGARLGVAIPLGEMVSGNTWPISHWVPLNVPTWAPEERQTGEEDERGVALQRLSSP